MRVKSIWECRYVRRKWNFHNTQHTHTIIIIWHFLRFTVRRTPACCTHTHTRERTWCQIKWMYQRNVRRTAIVLPDFCFGTSSATSIEFCLHFLHASACTLCYHDRRQHTLSSTSSSVRAGGLLFYFIIILSIRLSLYFLLRIGSFFFLQQHIPYCSIDAGCAQDNNRARIPDDDNVMRNVNGFIYLLLSLTIIIQSNGRNMMILNYYVTNNNSLV